MSRIIVKNLPKGISEKKLEELFAAKGVITDLQLKYNKKGVFRQFAFIGFKTEEEANVAKDYFHNTFVNTSKIKVEICYNLGDSNKPKPWNNATRTEKIEARNEENEKKHGKKAKKKKHIDLIPEDLKGDVQFKEFLKVNESRSSKPVWAEDIDINDLNSEAKEESSSSSDDDTSQSEHEEKNISKNHKSVKKEELLDTSKENEDVSLNQQNKRQVKPHNDMFTVILRNLPYHCKKSHIKKFFHPSKIVSLRLPPKRRGFAYVSFKTEKDMKKALIKHRGFLEGHRVDVIKYAKKTDGNNKLNNGKFNENDKELNEELLAETGRIYVRNLCYSVEEEEINQLFSKFGPVEVHLPIDFNTKKAKGFAFVTFMFAEHAVKAYSELDGTIFQGRLLHLIPAKPKKEYDMEGNENNFKKKKEAERKKESGSSHNWNILFLGMNAVADVVAEKYGIEKASLLSGDSKKSPAVRMALAETEMVEETRKFLIENGVQLDAFSQPNAELSKTVIIVKHLPSKTTAEEIHEVFSKHGSISRVLVPPSGMVALVEYEKASEAKVAFTKLAYRRFGTEPLFLGWAPMGGLTIPPPKETEIKDENETKETEFYKGSSKGVEADVPPEEGTTVYVKNINFATNQADFEEHFKQCGPIYRATISTKKDIKTGKTLSMGFGFVQFVKKESAVYAIQNLQLSVLDGHSLELKFAAHSISKDPIMKRKKYVVKQQTSSKILVRNLAFQASEQEVRDLFKEFGALKNVRLPKKFDKSGEHKGFGFVEYQNEEDAERAFNALCHSTHLFNRRLVLEWANPDPNDVSELRKKTAENYLLNKPKQKVKKSQLLQDVAMAAARQSAQNDSEEDAE